jgi:DNA-binding response OmpR family regulator
MVQGFARQSGGDVRLESVVGRGTIVSLWLPRATNQAATKHWVRAASNGGSANIKRIMLVDDEATVRETLSWFLSDAGFCPIETESADVAFRMLQAGECCDLVITDQSMPGMKGSDLIARIARLWPELPTLLMTGYDRVSGLEELAGHVTVLRKPFRYDAFLHQVKALLAATPRVPQPEVVTPNVVLLREKTS